ncbi:hypothetical protein QTP70_018247, partial [Hemibagrus guttatus]
TSINFFSNLSNSSSSVGSDHTGQPSLPTCITEPWPFDALEPWHNIMSTDRSCGVFPVCSGQYLSKVIQGRNSGELATGRPRLTDARGEQRLARVVRSNRRATVAQIAEEVNAGSDRKVSEYTVHDGSGLF